eukprot:12586181-Alexandrium_andersonii.AAC.1
MTQHSPRKRRRRAIFGALGAGIEALPGNRRDQHGPGQPWLRARPAGRLRTCLGPHVPARQ